MDPRIRALARVCIPQPYRSRLGIFLSRFYARRQGQAPRISLFVTSDCSVGCRECIMRHLMAGAAGYHMGLDEVQRFLKACERSSYRFEMVLTGGEPLEWRHFREGVRMLRSSRACQRLVVFSNVHRNIDLLDDEVMRRVDMVRVSKYALNKANSESLADRYPGKVCCVEREEFWENPGSPIMDALPAECLNPEVFLFRDRVYACPHSASIAFFNGSRIPLSRPVAPGFLRGLKKIKRDQQEEICTMCISNQKVRERVPKVFNVSSTARGSGR